MNAVISLLQAGWLYAGKDRGRMALYIFMFVLANIVLLVEPLVIGKLLNTIQEIQTLEDPLSTLGWLFLMMVGIQFLFWVFHGPARVMENSIAFNVRANFIERLFHILTSLPVQWHRDHHSGQTINRIRKASNALYDYMSNGYNLVEMIVRLIGSVTAIMLLQPVGALLAFAVISFAMVVVFFFDRILIKQYEELNEKDHFVASALHDYITNIYTVITLRLEKLTRTELWKRITVYFPLYRKNNVINETKWFISTIIISLMTVTVLAWYALGTLNSGGVLLAGTVYILYEYLQKIGSVFYTFAWKYSQMVHQYADLKSVQEILDAAPAEKRDAALPGSWKEISIDNLNFSYEDKDKQRQHLSNISFTMKKGQKIALVGESGSGKSTLMSIIRGLYEPDTVTVRCDGKELPDCMAHLASHSTLIPQEPEIFSNTIEYNVSVDTEQSKEELLQDIDLACFTPVLERLPRGLETDIAEKGVNLSGGEKQRLALARGIFAAKQSDIILLDEPTSSVDSMNELKIHKNIFGRFSDRCIIASIHRLHLLPLFDHVIVLENGKIVEQGAPDALMEGDGMLATLWQHYRKTQKDE